jgi:hypothetical protein
MRKKILNDIIEIWVLELFYAHTLTSTDTTCRYNDSTYTLVIRGIRPFDQADSVLQPDSSISSSSKILRTSVGLYQSHTPYFLFYVIKHLEKPNQFFLKLLFLGNI